MMKEFIIPFSTGIAIFLFGLQVMRLGFENLFLDQLKKFFFLLTKTPLIGLLTGTLATAMLQSSSAVTLLIISLTNSKIISFRQALGIILGANIGTCVTTEMIAFPIEKIGIYLFVVGFILFLIPPITVRSIGLALGGFGLLFVGMETMQSITPAIKQWGWIDTLYLFSQDGVLGGVVAGTILTALIQSSSATIAIAMNLIYDQVLPLTIAIAIVLGSNIGTCLTAVLGSIGTNKASRQVAVAHVLLNVLGVIVFLPLIPFLSNILEWLTPNPMKQVAHAQTLFNIICSLMVLPYLHLFERLVIYVTPK